jgi:hypothetical protein
MKKIPLGILYALFTTFSFAIILAPKSENKFVPPLDLTHGTKNSYTFMDASAEFPGGILYEDGSKVIGTPPTKTSSAFIDAYNVAVITIDTVYCVNEVKPEDSEYEDAVVVGINPSNKESGWERIQLPECGLGIDSVIQQGFVLRIVASKEFYVPEYGTLILKMIQRHKTLPQIKLVYAYDTITKKVSLL